MVRTQNDGHLMGYVAGPIHTDVWTWRVAVHHNIGTGGTPMDRQARRGVLAVPGSCWAQAL